MANSTVVVFDDPTGPMPPGTWSDLVRSAGLGGEVMAPIPAGWFGTPLGIGGHPDVIDPIFHVLTDLADVDQSRVAIGVGGAGWPATLIALAGRARALVLVDGCGGPWLDPAERSRRQSAVLAERREELLGFAKGDAEGGSDGSAGHGAGPAALRGGHHNRALAFEAAEELVDKFVSVLLIETPRSTSPADEVDELSSVLGTTPVRVAQRTPGSLAPALEAWVRSL